MEFTGERLVPTSPGHDDLFLEHMARYMFASGLVRGKAVLDAGCGCGYGSYHMARAGAGSVLGVDRAEEAVAYARDHFADERLSFRTGDVLDTGLDEASFDRIVSFEVFEHVPGPERFLDEMRRVLRPDGILILSTPNAETYTAGGEDGRNPYHVREYTPPEFDRYLAARFGRVVYFAQSPWAGLGIFPVSPAGSAAREDARLRLLDPPAQCSWGEPVVPVSTVERCAYLIAVCFGEEAGEEPLPGAELYGIGRDLGSGNDDRARLIRQLHGLHCELDGRARWIENLKREIEARDQTIRKLQAEFEERSQWALSLNRTVEEQARVIAVLRGQRTGVA